jgi:hypothetical protein
MSETFPITKGFGYKTKVAVVVFGIYVVGLLLRFVCESLFASAYLRLASAPCARPWDNKNWQELATTYIERVSGFPKDKIFPNHDWQWLYRTLSFASREQPLDVPWHMSMTVMTSGVAGLLLLLLIHLPSRRLCLLWSLAAVTVAVVGAFVCVRILGYAQANQSQHSGAQLWEQLKTKSSDEAKDAQSR